MPCKGFIINLFKVLFTVFVFCLGFSQANAFNPSFYASNSVLSKGVWVKIRVNGTGMHLVSDETLAALGFSDPQSVNVYGYGGVMIPENLDSPDDLPLVPSIRVADGLIFFGVGTIDWQKSDYPLKNYSHISNPYSDYSYYFLSDANGKSVGIKTRESSYKSDRPVINEFRERLIHENDITPAMKSGRLYLGEDFKATPQRRFSFSLPGNIGDAVVTTSFACHTSGGISSLVFMANGIQLGATEADKMPSSSLRLITTTETVKTVETPGESLDLDIRFNGSGTVEKAALDYIEIEYPRSLTMTSEELYFFVEPDVESIVRIENADETTRIWDVSDPVNPFEISADFSDRTLLFSVTPGYHEYIAFNPDEIKRKVEISGQVMNQNNHALKAPDMLVISPAEYFESAQRLAALHKQTDGLDVLVLTPEEIYNEFSSGNPDVSAFRKLLKMWYDRAGGSEGSYTEFCLIMSRPTYDNKMLLPVVKNAGYPRIPIWQSPSGDSEATSYSTDDYIGMLEDVAGDFNIETARINVAVGRMPVKSGYEAERAIDKLEGYLSDNEFGAWRNNVLVVADDQDNGIHLNQAENALAAMRNNGNGDAFLYEKLYLDSFNLEYTATGATYPAATDRLKKKFEEGVVLINYVGHANATSWSHEHLLTWSDIKELKNSKLPFIYAATCEFMRWDDDNISGAEEMWLNQQGGVIGMICPSREVLIAANGMLNKATSRHMFSIGSDNQPLPLGKIMLKGKNESNTNSNRLRYGFLGDPSMRLPLPLLRIKVDSINSISFPDSDSEEYPVLQARSRVSISGHLEDMSGNDVSDFNGVAAIQLFDAEKAITTNGNGADGVQSVYNDRPTRLYTGKMKVQDGQWSTTINMPSEIENNYAPALLSFYACDEEGRQANGTFDKLYVFGYDENMPEDETGPEFIEFYLNNPSFTDGQAVGPAPCLYAKFRDESGISVSQAGIGHDIILEIDGEQFLNISDFYEPDEEDPCAGSIVYILSGLKTGDHSIRLIVWDNSDNSSAASLNFSIPALRQPTIESLSADMNPATTSVNFIVIADALDDVLNCLIEVYDISGRRVWSVDSRNFRSSDLNISVPWHLNDYGGGRVQPGLYIYRATLTTSSGARAMKTNKLIVAGN